MEAQTIEATVAYYDALADHYDACLADWTGAIHRQADVLHTLIERELGPGSRDVIDAACGIGTQSIGLAAKGHRIVGLDVSPRALDRAQREARLQGLEISLHRGDIRELDLHTSELADVIVCIDNAFAHLTSPSDMRAAAASMRRALRTPGLVVIGVRDYDRHQMRRPDATVPIVSNSTGAARVAFQRWKWIDEHHYEPEQFLLTQTVDGWTVQTFRGSPVRAVTRAELTACFEEAGFDVRWMEPAHQQFHQPLLLARG